jgi:hypothetical protein
MNDARCFRDLSDERTGIGMRHPPDLIVGAEIKDTLDDVIRVLLWVNGLWVNVPKQRWTEFYLLRISFRNLARFGSFHASILPYFSGKFQRLGM